MFALLPDKPDHDALELGVLELWAREETFRRLRELNAHGPLFSFVDGPVTANKMLLGVHTAWGRTLKDVFQRYKALRGHHQRYQNGFDCQGLWIEVGVERSLGLNSKREIEEYGLNEFARRCREMVIGSSQALTEGSIRLGQWMDWGADYFTFSDTNIEYIWRFLRLMHDRGRLYIGHRSTEWCPRCGTSLSQHELSQSGVYQDRSDPSLTVRFPLRRPAGESLVIWTTTPWTLPANVAAAVHPDAGVRPPRKRRVGDGRALPHRDVRRDRAGLGARRAPLRRAPSTRCRRARGSSTASSPGTRSRSTREPGSSTSPRAAAPRTSSSPASTTCRSSPRSTSRVASTTSTAGSTELHRRCGRPDRRRSRRAWAARPRRALRAPLPALLALRHAPHLPHLRRLVPLRRRAPPASARGERDRRVDARLHGQADGRLAAEHGRLEHLAAPLLRASAAVLPLRVRPPERRRVEARAARARDGACRGPRRAASPVGRRDQDPLRVLRRGGRADRRGRRRLARRGDRPVLDARVREPRERSARVCDRRRAGA